MGPSGPAQARRAAAALYFAYIVFILICFGILTPMYVKVAYSLYMTNMLYSVVSLWNRIKCNPTVNLEMTRGMKVMYVASHEQGMSQTKRRTLIYFRFVAVYFQSGVCFVSRMFTLSHAV